MDTINVLGNIRGPGMDAENSNSVRDLGITGICRYHKIKNQTAKNRVYMCRCHGPYKRPGDNRVSCRGPYFRA